MLYKIISYRKNNFHLQGLFLFVSGFLCLFFFFLAYESICIFCMCVDACTGTYAHVRVEASL